VCCNVLQFATVCRNVLQCAAVSGGVSDEEGTGVLQRVSYLYGVL